MKLTKKSDVKLNDLYNYASEKAKELWGREFNIEIELVYRKWKRRRGGYVIYSDGRSLIRMSKPVNDSRVEEDVFKTLLHELVHWHLHTSGKPFRDSDKEFVEEAKRVGAPFSQTIKAKNALRKYG